MVRYYATVLSENGNGVSAHPALDGGAKTDDSSFNDGRKGVKFFTDDGIDRCVCNADCKGLKTVFNNTGKADNGK